MPEQVQEIFERVRDSADFMPMWQLEVRMGVSHDMGAPVCH